MTDEGDVLDLTGGRDPEVDFVIAEPPTDPIQLEGVNMWLWDDAGQISLPRVGVDAQGATWTSERMVSVNVALRDGRIYLLRANEAPHPAQGADGRPRVIAGGPLRFECLEPFRSWLIRFDGQVEATTVRAQLEADARPDVAHSTVPLGFEIEAHMEVPPWTQGTFEIQGQYVAGEDRYEQLFSAKGRVTIDGNESEFVGGGLRVHRRGGRRSDMSDWRGHCWQSANFASGRAFGYIHHAARPGGSARYCEGFVFENETMFSARVVNSPWMTTVTPSGQDVSFALEYDGRRAEIKGETIISTFSLGGPIGNLQQGTVRYRWDGEHANGMIERSYPDSDIKL
jgi:hypothetical protein